MFLQNTSGKRQNSKESAIPPMTNISIRTRLVVLRTSKGRRPHTAQPIPSRPQPPRPRTPDDDTPVPICAHDVDHTRSWSALLWRFLALGSGCARVHRDVSRSGHHLVHGVACSVHAAGDDQLGQVQLDLLCVRVRLSTLSRRTLLNGRRAGRRRRTRLSSLCRTRTGSCCRS